MSESCDQKIFVVDDDPTTCKFLKLMLQKSSGCSVITFNNPEQAWSSLDEHRPHVICIDLSMPQLTGIEWMVRLSEAKRMNDFHIVLVTGQKIDEEFTFKMMSMGVAEVFEKPVKQEDLGAAIQELLQEPVGD